MNKTKAGGMGGPAMQDVAPIQRARRRRRVTNRRHSVILCGNDTTTEQGRIIRVEANL